MVSSVTAALVGLSAACMVASGQEPRTPIAASAPTEDDVVPILLRRCTVCHGLRRHEAELDLRTREGMLRGGKSGPAIVPGKPDESLLIQKVRAGEMPPLRRVVEVSIKPIEPAEIEKIARWIESGAAQSLHTRYEADTDPSVADADRTFWSFVAPQRCAIPIRARGITDDSAAVSQASPDDSFQTRGRPVIRNEIDAFVADKLGERGLSFAPEADRLTLMRRAYLDLTGMPPEPDEVLAYAADDRADAYERLIDRLLDSPRYGERWARHWLDVAGYADSEGKTDQDLRRPSTWRYRDYVIRSFNADKPYDRFLTEQLAGDELADFAHASEISDEIYDNLVATGFLRMAPDGTFANITNFVPDRLEVIADEIQVLGSGVMGLTLHCARCHNHKFDPVPQRDYYRLLDIFKGAYDEHDWLKPNPSEIASMGDWGYRQLPYVTSAERRIWEANENRLVSEIASAKAALESQALPFRAKHVEQRLLKLPAELQDDLRRMLSTPAAERTEILQYLAGKFEKSLTIDLDELRKIDDEFRKIAELNDKSAKALEAKRRPAPTIHALWDRGAPSPTFLLRRGDYLNPLQRVTAGVPAVLAGDLKPYEVLPAASAAETTGRRLAFAQWLTQPRHPLTARVMVNRIWKHHFGTGLVKTLGNFGKTGAPPTHPELLDWLATEFVERGWSMKAMHRLLMTSTTYRQTSRISHGVSTSVRSSEPAAEAASRGRAGDPDGLLYSRMPMRRVDAEVLYDMMLAVSDRLDERPFGAPDPVEVSKDGEVTPIGHDSGWRRSIYVEQRRKQIPTLLESFDLPQMNPNCVERIDSNVATQALHLMNNGMVHKLAQALAERVRRDAGSDRARQIDRLYLIALSRLPAPEESSDAQATLAQLESEWAKSPASSCGDGASPELRALAGLCHAIMNSAEFLYVD